MAKSPHIPEELAALIGGDTVTHLKRAAKRLGIKRLDRNTKDLVGEVLRTMDRMSAPDPATVANSAGLMEDALRAGFGPQSGTPGPTHAYGMAPNESKAIIHIPGRGSSPTPPPAGPSVAPGPEWGAHAAAEAEIRRNIRRKPGRKGPPIPVASRPGPAGLLPGQASPPNPGPSEYDIPHTSKVTAGGGKDPFMKRVMKGYGRQFRKYPVATGLGTIGAALGVGSAVAGWGKETFEDLSGDNFQRQIDREVNAAIYANIQRMKAERLQQQMAVNTARLAQADPHLYNEVLAGRRLPPGAVVIGGTPRTDMLGELAAAMSDPALSQNNPGSDPLASLLR